MLVIWSLILILLSELHKKNMYCKKTPLVHIFYIVTYFLNKNNTDHYYLIYFKQEFNFDLLNLSYFNDTCNNFLESMNS